MYVCETERSHADYFGYLYEEKSLLVLSNEWTLKQEHMLRNIQ